MWKTYESPGDSKQVTDAVRKRRQIEKKVKQWVTDNEILRKREGEGELEWDTGGK